MDYVIVSADPNGLRTKSVKVLVKEGANVRRGEIILPLEAELTLTTEQVQAVWDANANDPLGLRLWAAAQQRSVNDLLDRTMFNVFAVMQGNPDLNTLLGAALMVLNEDPAQMTYYTKIATALNEADEITRNNFLAAVIVVAIGKLGQ